MEVVFQIYAFALILAKKWLIITKSTLGCVVEAWSGTKKQLSIYFKKQQWNKKQRLFSI